MPGSPHVGQHFRSVGFSGMAGEGFEYSGVRMAIGVCEVWWWRSHASLKGKVGNMHMHMHNI
jgi:hypothetical protein